jgi:CheY-like chemotaxis protein
MSRLHHILVATPRPPGDLIEVLGPSVQLHFAQDADECLALAASLHPELALLDLADPELGDEEFIRMMQRSLGKGIPIVGLGDASQEGRWPKLLRAGVWDIWAWEDPNVLTRKRLENLTKLHRLRLALQRSHRRRRDAQKALIQFLRRLEEIVAHPLDSLEAYLVLLYQGSRRQGAPATHVLDEIACHLQEIRRTLVRLRRLARSLARSSGADPSLQRSLEEDGKSHAEPGRRVRWDSHR